MFASCLFSSSASSRSKNRGGSQAASSSTNNNRNSLNKRISLLRSRSESEETMSKSDDRGAFRGSYDGRRGSYDVMNGGRGSYDSRRGSYDVVMSKSPVPPVTRFSPSHVMLNSSSSSLSPDSSGGRGAKPVSPPILFYSKKDSSRSFDENGSYRRRKSDLNRQQGDERGFLDRAFESAANIDDQLLEDKKDS